MKFEIYEVEEAILREFNKENITFNNIVASKDKGLLDNYVEVINNVTKDYNILFQMDKFLTDEYLLLKNNSNIKLYITNFYLNIIIEH